MDQRLTKSCLPSFIDPTGLLPTLGFSLELCARFARFLPSHLSRKGTGHGSLHSTLAPWGSDPHYHSSRSILALGAAMAMTSNREAVRVPEQSVESSASAVEWGAIAGGALAAIGISKFQQLSGDAHRADPSLEGELRTIR